jgi:hypothetical protein
MGAKRVITELKSVPWEEVYPDFKAVWLSGEPGKERL